MTTIKSSCTDAELSAAVAEHCIGWKLVHSDGPPEHMLFGYRPGVEPDSTPEQIPPFATSCDAVFSLLEKTFAEITWGQEKRLIYRKPLGRCNDWVAAPNFPRAACFSLLRAHGVAVEDAG